MAQATLNPAIDGLDASSVLYDLYTRFYDGITKANNTDAPDFVTNPIYEKNDDGTDKIDEDGAKIIDQVAIAESLKEYTEILTKNSAYMMADAIIASISGSGTGDSTGGLGFVMRNGDTMQGTLGALYGFEAGSNNIKVFETTVDKDNVGTALVTGSLQVSDDVTISGSLNLYSDGISFDGSRTIWGDADSLYLSSSNIELNGNVVANNKITVGNVVIGKDSILLGEYEYYHSGNSNKADVDWAMNDANVSGDLQIDGGLYSNAGFTFSVQEQKLLYSEPNASNTASVILNSDLSIINDHGIKVNGGYVIWVRNDSTVSFSAPGVIMNLGDKGNDSDGNDTATKYIALQTNIMNDNGAYTMVTHDGSGNFPNGFSVGAANALGTTFQTYYTGSDDYGVLSKNNMCFGTTDGPRLYSDGTQLGISIPHFYLDGGVQRHTNKEVTIKTAISESPILNPTSNSSIVAMCFNTQATHFTFGAPIEATKFVVKSEKYKTQLDEDVLFFNDGVFIEGLKDGMRLSQNSMFDGDLYSYNSGTSSISFSSGFAGSGWAILKDKQNGDIGATFDDLTIRKKMRVYELEVQKASVTNGSLWVSDACSGDLVEEVI